ncbi:MAG: TauD/TfdA family dioxygenase [Myxococcales bacterium]|nr:TauD/TfdA family dioxygenase [Myxococcales bacterium]
MNVPFDLLPVAGALGAEVRGVDLGAPLDDATVTALGAALAEHLVLFFHDQAIAPDAQVALGERFGSLDVHPAYSRAGLPAPLAVLEHTAERPSLIEEWHTDMTFRACPPLGSILQARVVPERGGDTLWSSMHAAWEALSDRMQRLLSDMTAIHDFRLGFRHSLAAPGGPERLAAVVAANPPVEHPVVRRHPVTGRPGLFVNQLFTTHLVGVPEAESRALLDFLFRHVTAPEFTVRFRWRAGSVAFWDNRATQHRPVNDHGPQHRLLHRVTIQGDRPVGMHAPVAVAVA